VEEPRWANARFCADFRATDVCIERFPEGCDSGAAYEDLVKLVEDLRYEGYIEGKENSYQVNLTFDARLHERACSGGHRCVSGPVLSAPREVARAVGLRADMLLQVPGTDSVIVVEIEKANREKILRDIVKMLLFFEAKQADLAALICPRIYVHGGGAWKLFDTARQVLRAFVRVTQLPEDKAKRLALIGFTQEAFLGGRWMAWDETSREEIQMRARKHFQTV
jgi:hypothetical protein